MRRPLTSRRLLAAVPAAALVLALGACGSDTETASDSPSTAQSSSAPAEAESPPAQGEQVDTQEFLDRLAAAAQDLTTAQTSMKMTTAGTAMTAEGSMDYTTTPPSMSMTMTMDALGGGPMEIRMVDGVVYMNMGALTQGKFWKLDPKDENSPLGDLGDLTDSMDPTKALENYEGGFDSVVYVGDEEVDGETLAHYSVTIDSAKLAESATAGLPKTLTYDLWLDDQDRTRKAQMDMGTSGSMTMEVFGYGDPVTIEAPPADQIVKLPAGMGGGA